MSAPRKDNAQPKNIKRRKQEQPYSPEEWAQLPVTLDCIQVARALGCCARWVSDHGAEIGGRKVAGRWVFGKGKIAALVGIEG